MNTHDLVLIFILGALKFGYQQALFTGFIPLSSATAQGTPLKKTLQTVLNWLICFMIAIFIGMPLLYFARFILLNNLNGLEYMLVIFLGVINLINLSSKRAPFNNFLYNRRWIYALGVLQGFGAVGNLIWIYAVTSEVTFFSIFTVGTIYAITFCGVVCFFAIGVGVLTLALPKARTALIVFFSILGIVTGLLHFFFGLI